MSRRATSMLLNKGKSKGKGKSDQCLRCNAKGHYSWACPTPRDSTGTRVCDRCGGKGHLKWQCPTANPALKGHGKDKGQGGQKGVWKIKGKGKGYKGGGSKGKGGVSSFDFMWAEPDSGWGSPTQENWNNDWRSYGGLNSLNSLSAAQPAESPEVQNRFQALAQYSTGHDHIDTAPATMLDISLRESFCGCRAGCSHVSMPRIDEALDGDGFRYVSRPGRARKFGNAPPRQALVGSTPWADMDEAGMLAFEQIPIAIAQPVGSKPKALPPPPVHSPPAVPK